MSIDVAVAMTTPVSPRLEVKDLRLVLALASAGTTARAAELLHLAQPSVSRALLSLEERLETQLFERTSGGLVANVAGARLISAAGAMLEQIVDLERSVVAPRKQARRVRLVCECHTAYHWLPSTLVALRRHLPELDLELCVEHTEDAVGALAEGTIDAALVTSPVKQSSAIRVGKLFSDEIVFVVAATHPLAGRGVITTEDLRTNALFTARPTTNEARWFASRVFGRGQPRLDITYVPLTEAMMELARAGLGIAIATEWVAKPHLSRSGASLVALAFDKGPLRRPWRLAWRRELGPLGTRLCRALRDSNIG